MNEIQYETIQTEPHQNFISIIVEPTEHGTTRIKELDVIYSRPVQLDPEKPQENL